MAVRETRGVRHGAGRHLAARALIVVVSIYLMTFGFALYLKAGVGSDSISLLVDGINHTFGMAHGMASNLVNLLLFVVMVVLNRGCVGFATVISAFGTGTFLQLNLDLLNLLSGGEPFPLWVNLLFPVLGAVLNAGSIGLYLTMDLGASPFDGAVLTLERLTPLSYQNAMYVVNAAFFLLGVALGGVWGYGTVVAVALSGFLFQRALNLMRRLTGALVNSNKERETHAVSNE